MKHYDNHQIEESLYKQGFKYICGTDEAGRGPLAGPVVAAAVIMPKGMIIEGVTDSKKVTLKNRLILEKEIKEKALAYSVIFIDEKTIDDINILEASRLAMTEAIKSLKIIPDYVLTDAMKLDIDLPYQDYIKGDSLSFTIACASILAKVARDEYMIKIAKKYPEYGFDKHKGYGTKAHLEAIEKYGICPIHRQSFGPVKNKMERTLFDELYQNKE